MQEIIRPEDDDDFEVMVMPDGSRRKILKDGRSYRVPLRLCDSMQREIAANAAAMTNDLHRPGFRVLSDAAARDAKQEAYDAYDADLTARWQDGNPVGAHVGDLCTVRGPEFPNDFGSPGHLQERDRKLVCVPDRRQDAAVAVADAKAEAYETYEATISNAWRCP